MNIGYVTKFQKAAGLHVIYYKEAPQFQSPALLLLMLLNILFLCRPARFKIDFSLKGT